MAAAPKVAVSFVKPANARHIATRPVAADGPIAAGPIGPGAVDGSGIVTAMPTGALNPETSEAFTTAPTWCIRQSCRVPPIRDKQVRSGHGKARRITQPRDQRGVHDCPRRGVFANRAGQLVRDKQVRSGHGNANGPAQPRDQRGVHRCSRRGVFANRAAIAVEFVTNRFDPDTAMPHGPLNPETREAFTLPPTWYIRQSCSPYLEFATNRFDPDTAMPYAFVQPRDQRGVHRLPPTWYIRQSCR